MKKYIGLVGFLDGCNVVGLYDDIHGWRYCHLPMSCDPAYAIDLCGNDGEEDYNRFINVFHKGRPDNIEITYWFESYLSTGNE